MFNNQPDTGTTGDGYGVDLTKYPKNPARDGTSDAARTGKKQGDNSGEDKGSASKEGKDDHLKEDQKQAPPSGVTGEGGTGDEMKEARKHDDPAQGDKVVDGGDGVSTKESGNPQE